MLPMSRHNRLFSTSSATNNDPHSRSKSNNFIQLTHNDSLMPHSHADNYDSDAVDLVPSPCNSPGYNDPDVSSYMSPNTNISPTKNLFRGVIGIDDLNAEITSDADRLQPFSADDVMLSIHKKHSHERTKSILQRRPSLSRKIESKPSLLLRLKKFELARIKRSLKYGGSTALGVVNTFEYLAGVRSDIEFSRRAVEERKRIEEVNEVWEKNLELTESNAGLMREPKSPDVILEVRSPRPPITPPPPSTSAQTQPSMSWTQTHSALHHRPYFTIFTCLSTLVMLIVSIALNSWHLEPFNVNPMLGPKDQILLDVGALDTTLIVEYGEGWRLITPWFLHAGIIHYILNMISFAVLGRMLERAHGTIIVSLIFIVSAMCGSITSALFLQTSVGASGGGENST
ncbi:hypothetical protein TL16_g01927 [Triparma laevis f. inornata]|uniref:rhomboid protease n=1 Tax=Triparma laevis f. inornata TaxID=1714386 RepID=A0A9W6ZQI0_9STRA|nr:hypothetical protein TL16_g01927 [Triparma laevis f. inornata]